MSRGVDRQRVAAAVRELLSAIGEDPDSETFAETPGRVAAMHEGKRRKRAAGS